MLFGAIETGGSKVDCAVGAWSDDVRDRMRIPTTGPTETLARVTAFLLRHHQATPLAAIGIGSFGPLDLRTGSPTYGCVTSTPKPGWRNADVVGPIREGLGLPVVLDTDVNAAALGEYRRVPPGDLDSLVYITVGTGIGGGAVIGGRPVHGASHPEMGHVRIPHDRSADPFDGSCPYHGDCLEGLASGPAMEARWGMPPASLPDDHPAWLLEAEYLASGVANIMVTLSPQRIVMGGGVMKQRRLFPLIRRRVIDVLRGYGLPEEIMNAIDDYIVPPALGDDSGIAGAFALARLALCAPSEESPLW